MIRKIFSSIVSCASLLTAMACGGTNSTADTSNNTTTETAKSKKAIVVYFSHTGENYSVGNITIGNTKRIADYVSELTGAEQFEVICEKDYDKSYREVCDIAKAEQNAGELPSYVGDVNNMDSYDIVYVGTPIWWGTFPQVLFTFFGKHDLNGKTIVPFATHEGSGMGRTVRDLKRLYPNATIAEGLSVYGHDCATAKPQVEKWLKNIGMLR